MFGFVHSMLFLQPATCTMSNKAALEKLKFCNFKLDTLLVITQSINNNEPVSKLLDRYQRLLHNELNIPNILLYSHDQNWQAIFTSGIGSELYDKISVEEDMLNFKNISTTNYEKNEHIARFDMIIPVFHKKRAIAYLLIGDSEDHPGMSYSIKHLQFIQTMTNIILVAIENKRLAKEKTKQEDFMADLHLAARMQKLLIPENSELPKEKHLAAAGYYQPHMYVGGDFYDFIPLSDTEYGFAIADVTGKGVSAALLMSNLQANLRALFTSEIPLPDLVNELNAKVIDIAEGDRFITMFVGRYNATTKTISYINAGHEPPLFVFENREKNYLKNGCVGLGMLDTIPAITTGEVSFEGTARLICYTDGIIEIKVGTEVKDNTHLIEKLAAENGTIDEMVENLINHLDLNEIDDQLFDDISVLALEFF